MTSATPRSRPPAWDVLERALTERRAVKARYHGHERIVCPHELGWKNDRAKALVYQSNGTTSAGGLPIDRRHRWRTMFVDEIEHATLVDDEWETADNYTPYANGIDQPVLRLPERA